MDKNPMHQITEIKEPSAVQIEQAHDSRNDINDFDSDDNYYVRKYTLDDLDYIRGSCDFMIPKRPLKIITSSIQTLENVANKSKHSTADSKTKVEKIIKPLSVEPSLCTTTSYTIKHKNNASLLSGERTDEWKEKLCETQKKGRSKRSIISYKEPRETQKKAHSKGSRSYKDEPYETQKRDHSKVSISNKLMKLKKVTTVTAEKNKLKRNYTQSIQLQTNKSIEMLTYPSFAQAKCPKTSSSIICQNLDPSSRGKESILPPKNLEDAKRKKSRADAIRSELMKLKEGTKTNVSKNKMKKIEKQSTPDISNLNRRRKEFKKLSDSENVSQNKSGETFIEPKSSYFPSAASCVISRENSVNDSRSREGKLFQKSFEMKKPLTKKSKKDKFQAIQFSQSSQPQKLQMDEKGQSLPCFIYYTPGAKVKSPLLDSERKDHRKDYQNSLDPCAPQTGNERSLVKKKKSLSHSPKNKGNINEQRAIFSMKKVEENGLNTGLKHLFVRINDKTGIENGMNENSQNILNLPSPQASNTGNSNNGSEILQTRTVKSPEKNSYPVIKQSLDFSSLFDSQNEKLHAACQNSQQTNGASHLFSAEEKQDDMNTSRPNTFEDDDDIILIEDIPNVSKSHVDSEVIVLNDSSDSSPNLFEVTDVRSLGPIMSSGVDHHGPCCVCKKKMAIFCCPKIECSKQYCESLKCQHQHVCTSLVPIEWTLDGNGSMTF